MHRRLSGEEDDRRRSEHAARWWSRLREADVAERAEFATWLRESPGNLEAYLNTVSVTELIRDLPEERIARLAAGRAPDESHVLSWRRPVPAVAGQPARAWRWAAAACIALAAAIIAVERNADHPGWRDYSTRVAEQRTLRLGDGSRMHLNGHTRLRVRFSATGRDISLEEGEALFEVARDPARPFRVESGGVFIQALGTAFNVSRRPSGTAVSVAEGRVQVAQFQLAAGESARIAPDGRVEKSEPVDVVTVSAWRRHRLVFRADTLEDIATEFNRYNRTPRLVVLGDSSRVRRYSGAFDADDPQSFIGYLGGDADLALESRGEDLVIRIR